MKKKLVFELHKDGDCMLLDSQDAFQYLDEFRESDARLYMYIENLFEMFNYSILKNPDMMFDDAKENYLKGWVDAADFALKHELDFDGSTRIITGKGYILIVPHPFKMHQRAQWY